MDLKQATDFANTWLDLEHELHRLTKDPATPGMPAERIQGEWLPSWLSEDSWDGDAPFTEFTGRLEPHAHQVDNADDLERLGRRKLFKVELWSAPDVGGVARCLISRQAAAWSGMPEHILDFAEVGGAMRVVARHDPHPACASTGTLVKTGEPCTLSDRSGRPCVDGLIFVGGLSFDSGDLLESNPIETPSMGKWASYMER